jgi:hypothetical protein
MDARPRFTFALLLARGLGAADTEAAFVLAGSALVLALIVVVAADFAGTKGCATAVNGFCEVLAAFFPVSAAVVFAASFSAFGFSLTGFCVLSGIGLKAGPAALAIMLVVLSVQIYA